MPVPLLWPKDHFPLGAAVLPVAPFPPLLPAGAPGVVLFTPLAPGFVTCERDIFERFVRWRFARTAVSMSDGEETPATGPAGTATAGSDKVAEPAAASTAMVRKRIRYLLAARPDLASGRKELWRAPLGSSCRYRRSAPARWRQNRQSVHSWAMHKLPPASVYRLQSLGAAGPRFYQATAFMRRLEVLQLVVATGRTDLEARSVEYRFTDAGVAELEERYGPPPTRPIIGGT
jgi:hypothetical protein